MIVLTKHGKLALLSNDGRRAFEAYHQRTKAVMRLCGANNTIELLQRELTVQGLG